MKPKPFFELRTDHYTYLSQPLFAVQNKQTDDEDNPENNGAATADGQLSQLNQANDDIQNYSRKLDKSDDNSGNVMEISQDDTKCDKNDGGDGEGDGGDGGDGDNGDDNDNEIEENENDGIQSEDDQQFDIEMDIIEREEGDARLDDFYMLDNMAIQNRMNEIHDRNYYDANYNSNQCDLHDDSSEENNPYILRIRHSEARSSFILESDHYNMSVSTNAIGTFEEESELSFDSEEVR